MNSQSFSKEICERVFNPPIEHKRRYRTLAELRDAQLQSPITFVMFNWRFVGSPRLC